MSSLYRVLCLKQLLGPLRDELRGLVVQHERVVHPRRGLQHRLHPPQFLHPLKILHLMQRRPMIAGAVQQRRTVLVPLPTRRIQRRQRVELRPSHQRHVLDTIRPEPPPGEIRRGCAHRPRDWAKREALEPGNGERTDEPDDRGDEVHERRDVNQRAEELLQRRLGVYQHERHQADDAANHIRAELVHRVQRHLSADAVSHQHRPVARTRLPRFQILAQMIELILQREPVSGGVRVPVRRVTLVPEYLDVHVAIHQVVQSLGVVLVK
mmetsp:Transcript_12262/g.52792  ORF Transcript_12262/g.52792 Transcript_12262/m.52792 type:complete len:267 (+) Transcript_12262:15-815(+)